MFLRRSILPGKLIVAVAHTVKIPCITHIHYIHRTHSRCHKISRFGDTAFVYDNFFCKFTDVHSFTHFFL